MTCEPNDQSAKAKQASRAYLRDMAITSALYVAVVFGAVTLIRHSGLHLAQWMIVIIALTPLIPALLMMRTYLTFVRRMDEFNRRIQSEAWLISAGVVGLGSFTYGFLQEWAHFPPLDITWIFPALIATWGVATYFVRRRYS